MNALWISWIVAAVLLLLLYAGAGHAAQRGWLGILVDTRGRFSLSRMQLALWTLVVLPLVAAVFFGRAFTRGTEPFDFAVPGQVLGLLGLSVGTTVVATGIKARKDRTRPAFVAAAHEPSPGQMVLVEEGPNSDSVDLTKVQQLALSVLLAIAYVTTCVHVFLGAGPTPVSGPADIGSLPDFDPTFLTLLGVSQLGYVAGKIPNRGGVLPGKAGDGTAGVPTVAGPVYSLRDKVLDDAADDRPAKERDAADLGSALAARDRRLEPGSR
jgi:hypothetical protein